MEVVDIIGEENDTCNNTVVQDEAIQMLTERQNMELREELRRIDRMGRVDVLTKKMDRRLGRNLVRKLNTGPLDKKKRTLSLSHPRRHRRRRKKKKLSSSLQGGTRRRLSNNSDTSDMGGADMGLRELYRNKDQNPPQKTILPTKLRLKQELKEIERLGIVGSDSERRMNVRRHLSNHISRMKNHRLMILPQGGRDIGRKKSSVLVTSMENTDGNERELIRQQSRTVVGRFIQVHSHNQRVLQKLGSEELARGAAVRHGEYGDQDTNNDSMYPIYEENSISSMTPSPLPPPPPPSPPPPPLQSSRPPPTTLETLPLSMTSPITSPETPPASPGAPPFPMTSPETLPIPMMSLPISSGAPPIPMTSPETPPIPMMSLPISSGAPPIPVTSSEAPPTPLPSSAGSISSDNSSKSLQPISNGRIECDGGGGDGDGDDDVWLDGVVPRGAAPEPNSDEDTDDDGSGDSGSGDSADSGHDYYPRKHIIPRDCSPVDIVYGTAIQLHHVTTSSSSVSESISYVRTTQEYDGTAQGYDAQKYGSVSYYEEEEEEGEGEYIYEDTSQSSSDDHTSSHSHLIFPPSPHLSLNIPTMDYDPYVSCGHPSHTTPHGFYSTVEVNIDPFAKEFRDGIASTSSSSATSSLKGSSIASSKPSNHSRQLSEVLFSPLPVTITNCKKKIPSKAFKDKNFLCYISTLDHEADVSDYITYKVGVIGDRLEEKYADDLSAAVDEVFYELVKEKLSLSTFVSVSRKLLLQGARLQDGILLIPCFARQLIDYVPHLGNLIGAYTESVLDSYASDSILGMGGWGSMMENYGDDGDDYYDGTLQERLEEVIEQRRITESQPHTPIGHHHLTPGSNTRRRSHSNSDLLEPSSYNHHPSPLDHNIHNNYTASLQTFHAPDATQLRRWNSVEVLLDEPIGPREERPSPPTHPAYLHSMSYNRSISTHSVELATPPSSSIVGGHRFSPGFNLTLTSDLTSITSGLHEASRMSSRRGSASSVIVIPNHTQEEEQIPGFEIVGRVVPGTDVSGGGGGGGEGGEGKGKKGRRNSSLTEYVLPAATILHVVAVGFMYATT